jgi:hypothetical protein
MRYGHSALNRRGKSPTRSRTDRTYASSLVPYEQEALAIIEQRPGITVLELAEALGVGMSRVWVIVTHLQYDCVRLRRP